MSKLKIALIATGSLITSTLFALPITQMKFYNNGGGSATISSSGVSYKITADTPLFNVNTVNPMFTINLTKANGHGTQRYLCMANTSKAYVDNTALYFTLNNEASLMQENNLGKVGSTGTFIQNNTAHVYGSAYWVGCQAVSK